MIQRQTSVPDLADGDVVYFVYLHLNTVDTGKPVRRSHKERTYFYEVEGKARPMLVCGDPLERNGIKWHRVCPLTTKGLDESGKTKKGYIPVGNLIHPEKVSYLCCHPELYPENLLSVKNGSKCAVKRLDPQDMTSLMSILTKLLR